MKCIKTSYDDTYRTSNDRFGSLLHSIEKFYCFFFLITPLDLCLYDLVYNANFKDVPSLFSDSNCPLCRGKFQYKYTTGTKQWREAIERCQLFTVHYVRLFCKVLTIVASASRNSVRYSKVSSIEHVCCSRYYCFRDVHCMPQNISLKNKFSTSGISKV